MAGSLELVLTNLASQNVAFPSRWKTASITRDLNGYCSAQINMDRFDSSVASLIVAETAIKMYVDGTLRLYGQVWDPLQIGSQQGVQVNVRDPYAMFAWRRVRAAKTYTSTDAGAIISDRITLQNGYGPTGLRYSALSQASVNRTYTVNPGMLETDIWSQLSGMSQGFFYKINPVDNVPGTFAECQVLYPNAGATHEEVRFGYGHNTLDNLSDYQVSYGLPLNRAVVASSQSTGGRIIGLAEDATSEGLFFIFEDESDQPADITDTTLLTALANSMIYSVPPITFTLTPAKNAPLLFKDFDVGDFVRVHINDVAPDGSVAFSYFDWARVTSATLSFDPDGNSWTSAITVEALTGGKPLVRPEDAFRAYLDDQRATLEAIARKVANISASTVAPAGSGSGSTTTDPTTAPPPPTPAPPPPPPPAPPPLPVIESFTAYGFRNANRQQGGDFAAKVNPNGRSTTVWFVSTQPGNPSTPPVTITSDQVVEVRQGGGSNSTTYSVTCHAKNSAGEVTSTTSFTIPPPGLLTD